MRMATYDYTGCCGDMYIFERYGVEYVVRIWPDDTRNVFYGQTLVMVSNPLHDELLSEFVITERMKKGIEEWVED